MMLLFTTRRGAIKHDDLNAWIGVLISVCNNQELRILLYVFFDHAPAHVLVEIVIEQHEYNYRLQLFPYAHLINPVELGMKHKRVLLPSGNNA